MTDSLKQAYANLKAVEDEIEAAGYERDRDRQCWVRTGTEEVVPTSEIQPVVEQASVRHTGHGPQWADTYYLG